MAAQLQAVSTGHHDIQDEECWPALLCLGNHARAGIERAHSKAGLFQVVLDQPRDIGVVFDENNVRFHVRIVAAMGFLGWGLVIHRKRAFRGAGIGFLKPTG